MELKNIVDITTLKKYCNYKSNKNWKVFTKKGSPLPQLVYATHKNASGSLQVLELMPKEWDFKTGFAKPVYFGNITHLIFSYDSLIGVVYGDSDNICILNKNDVWTTTTTQKILTTLNKNFCNMRIEFYRVIIQAFELYTFTRLSIKGDY